MTYDEAVRYLLTLGHELASPQQARAQKFDLENIRRLSAHRGNPHRAYPSVHIAGTNGKGSTAAMLDSILRAAGMRTGLYTSPHLVHINERIALDGEEISDTDFAATFARVFQSIETLLSQGALAAHPTYFECLTAMAFDFFAQQRIDCGVLEVGMGGRLDATNILTPEVAVITQIDFDHENFLGHSIEQIAAEKAGIIKPGGWVVSAVERPEARWAIARRAAEMDARLVDVETVYRAQVEPAKTRGVTPATATGRYAVSVWWPHSRGKLEFVLPVAGRYQARNALAALAAARLLAERGFPVDDAAIVRGIEAVRWPGRLERVATAPDIYLDGTHNPAGGRELVAFWQEHLAGRRILLVYGAMRDKAVDEITSLLFPLAWKVILTEPRQPRAISAEALAGMTTHLAPAAGVEVVSEPTQALEWATALAGPDDVVFATGSLYLVGDLLRYWRTRTQQPASVLGAAASPTTS